jgi:hypothetical protein
MVSAAEWIGRTGDSFSSLFGRWTLCDENPTTLEEAARFVHLDVTDEAAWKDALGAALAENLATKVPALKASRRKDLHVGPPGFEPGGKDEEEE